MATVWVSSTIHSAVAAPISIEGYGTFNGMGPDGTAVTVAVTALPSAIVDDPNNAIAKYQLGLQAVDSTLCNH